MFGENLKKYRILKGYSQNDIAEKLFVTRQCVSKWEKGVTQPDLQTLTRLSEVLEVSVDALVKEDESSIGKAVKNPNAKMLLAHILIAIFCILSITVVWRFLPNTVPAHWTGGEIDRFGSRNEIFINLIVPIIFSTIDVFVYFALKRTADNKAVHIAHGTMILLQIAYLVFVIVLYARYFNSPVSLATCLSSAALLCVSVAMHPKINKQNYLLGVRTTKTLKSATVWKKTNTLACYLFASCSAIIFTVNMVWEIRLAFLCLTAYIPLAIAVIVYSEIIGKSDK